MRRFAGYISIVITLLLAVVFTVTVQTSSLNYGLEYGNGYEAVYKVDFQESTKNIDDIVNILTKRMEDAEVRNGSIESVSDERNDEYQVRVKANSENESTFDYVLRSMEATGKITVSTVLNEGDYTEIAEPFVTGSAKVEWSGSSPYVSVDVKDYDTFNNFITSCNDAYTKFKEKYDSDNSDSENTLDGVVVIWLDKTDTDSYLEAFENENDVIKEAVKEKILSIIPTSYFRVEKDVNDKVTSAKLLIDRYDFDQNIMVGQSAHTIERLLNYEPQDFSLTKLYVHRVNPTYGSNAINILMIGLGVSLGLLGIFLIVKYGLPGLSSIVVTCVSLLGSILVFNFFSYTLTTMVILGFIISIMINLIYIIPLLESFKDELYKGKAPAKASQEAFRTTKIASLDLLVCTLLVSIITTAVSINQVKLLPISIIISSIISYIVVRLLMRLCMWWLVNSKVSEHSGIFMVKKKDIPNVVNDETQRKFNFMHNFNANKKLKKPAIITSVITCACAITILVLGLIPNVGVFNYSDDFKSSTRIEITTEVVGTHHVFDKENDVISFLESFENKKMKVDSVDIVKVENVILDSNNRDDLPTIAYISVGLDGVYEFTDLEFEKLEQQIQAMEYAENIHVNVATSKSTTQNYVLDYSILTLAMFSLITVAYFLIRYKYSYGIASLATVVPSIVLSIAILAISRIPTTPLVLMGIASGAFVGVLTQIPLISRMKRYTRESKIKVTTYEQREDIAIRANKDSLHIVIILNIVAACLFLLVGIFSPMKLFTVYAGMIVSLAIVLLLTIFLFTPVYLKIEKFAYGIKVSHNAKRKEKKINKNKKKFEKVREAHKNVGSEPEESIIPGIND